MEINKRKTWFSVTNEHLYAVLQVNSRKLEPNIDNLWVQKQNVTHTKIYILKKYLFFSFIIIKT